MFVGSSFFILVKFLILFLREYFIRCSWDLVFSFLSSFLYFFYQNISSDVRGIQFFYSRKVSYTFFTRIYHPIFVGSSFFILVKFLILFLREYFIRCSRNDLFLLSFLYFFYKNISSDVRGIYFFILFLREYFIRFSWDLVFLFSSSFLYFFYENILSDVRRMIYSY